MKSIPEDWIKKYVDGLLKGAQILGPETKMGQAALLRAETIMDMVEAWRKLNGQEPV